MSESTKELNAILRKYEVSISQVAYWLYLTLERMTEDYRENYLEDIGEKEINRLDALADELNGLVNNHWHSIK
ncbi:hypothetical protein ACS2CL_19975 [Bacillus cereus group sp. BceL296]|uniref:hypothetical protein n=1 Tax=Bacillus TaxID=1386 RepID=UPI0001A12BCA|nr:MULTISPECIES: hypothetical protein [Bacillus]EEL73197.1 hypothetical protein bcere0027_55160 [Bacillus cereus AH676]EOP99082.1 hypothetical protein IIY_05127 [Bacillus cereus VD140]KMP42347.1 hypothetical protein TU56_26235 [Bacillus cereus]KZD36257.1 hypothetical protein B4081_1909 [Bacillus cereus]MBM6770553.1 hypothetical protein [Bacillus cereus]